MWILSIVIILIVAILILYLLSNLRAREWAIFHAKNVCKQYNVQLLDASIVQISLKISRDKEGRLCWQRSYNFEYSSNGVSRDIGKVMLHANRLCHISIFDENAIMTKDSKITLVNDEQNSESRSFASNNNVINLSHYRHKDENN